MAGRRRLTVWVVDESPVDIKSNLFFISMTRQVFPRIPLLSSCCDDVFAVFAICKTEEYWPCDTQCIR